MCRPSKSRIIRRISELWRIYHVIKKIIWVMKWKISITKDLDFPLLYAGKASNLSQFFPFITVLS